MRLSKLARRISRARLAGNISATLYNQIVQLGVQLASVPILTAEWGLTAYGIWLILFTAPAYLAIADLGFATAAGNDMTMRAARGDRSGAAETFLALQMIVVGMALVVIVVALVCLFLLFPYDLAFADQVIGGDGRVTLLIMIGYGVVALFSSVVGAGFRATDDFVVGTYSIVTISLVEAVTALVFASVGWGLFGAAIAYFAVRMLGTCMVGGILWRRSGWIYTRDWRGALVHLRSLLGPAIGALPMPAALALTLQGAVLVIGSAAGAAAVPVFTTVRILTRMALQFTFVVNIAIMPAYSMAAATDDRPRRNQLVLICLLTSLVALPLAAVGILAVGPFILKLWTHGRIDPPMFLLSWMTLAMVLNGIWMPLANLILAINLHQRFTYYFLAVSTAVLTISYPLSHHFGASGMAVALALIDALMLARILWLARFLGMLNPAELRLALHDGRRTFGV